MTAAIFWGLVALAAIEAAPITDDEIEAIAAAMWADDHDGDWSRETSAGAAIYLNNARTAITTYRCLLAARPRDISPTDKE